MAIPQNKNSEYQLAWRRRGEILHFQVTGDIDSQPVRIAYWQEIALVAKLQGMRKLLVLDRKKEVPATPAQLAELVAMMVKHRAVADRIGLVEPTAKFISAMEHVEIEGREVGINIRVFNHPQDAERWLMHGLSDEA